MFEITDYISDYVIDREKAVDYVHKGVDRNGTLEIMGQDLQGKTGRSSSSLLILVLLSMAQLMIVLDFSIVNVALPSIQSEFNLNPTELQWVVSAYALTFGSFLLLGGRASDIFNRKMVFLVGLTVFSIASLMGGLATSAILVFISRAVQGLGASMLSPSALSLITTTFPEGSRRNRALGIFGSMASIGFTTGVTLGGILTEFLSWHWVFFVNIPLGIITLIAGFLIIPNSSKGQMQRGFDITGAVLVATALLIIVYAITQISTPGESLYEVIILFGISLALAASFILFERRVCQPLIPLDIFHRRTLVISNIVMLLTYGANAALVLLITLFLQDGMGYSALQTGLIFIPAGFGGITGSFLVPRVMRRIDFRKLTVLGLIIFGLGITGLATVGTGGSIVALMVIYYFAALGLVSVIISLNIAGTTGVEAERQGLAAGLLITAQQIGAAIGVGIASVAIVALVLSIGDSPASLIVSYRYALLVSEGMVIISIILYWGWWRSL
jgi:EmrB/QacA subfamily drug resistance transporter